MQYQLVDEKLNETEIFFFVFAKKFSPTKGISKLSKLCFVWDYYTQEIWNVSDGETSKKLQVITDRINYVRHGLHCGQTKLGSRDFGIVSYATSLPNNTASQPTRPDILKTGSTLPQMFFLWTRSPHHTLLGSYLGQGTGYTDCRFPGHSPVLPGTWQDAVRLRRCKKGIRVEWRIELHRTLHTRTCQRHCSVRKGGTLSIRMNRAKGKTTFTLRGGIKGKAVPELK